MKHLTVSLTLLFCASVLPAQRIARPTLDCNNERGDDRRAHFCEMREQTVAATGTIAVDASQNGGITIKGWDRPDVQVRAQVRTYAATEGEAQALARQINVNSAGPQVKAYGPPSERDRYWSVSYEVMVPSRYSATAETINGGVTITDVVGNLEFKTVNGGLSLHRIGGNVHGRTTNGGVTVELAGDRWEGQGLDVTTTNGGVTLKVPRNYSAQLEAQTSNGGISVPDLAQPTDERGRRSNHISTPLGVGGAPIKITTTNGGVAVSRI